MDEQPNLPLISCICITDNRPEMLIKTIASFEAQNYSNKELVISYPQGDQKSKDLMEKLLNLNFKNLVHLERQKNESIGKARNGAIGKCNGEYICVWDDDDLHYPTRLTEQYQSLSSENESFDACVISKIIFYEATAKKAFISYSSHWSFTLLCKKSHLLNYPCDDRNEYEFTTALSFLVAANLIQTLLESPALYIFVYHGKNLMLYTTFLRLINSSEPLPDEVTQNIKSHFELQVSLQE